MTTFDFNEIELKMTFEYNKDYFTLVCDAIEPFWMLKRKCTKEYLDYYYDAPDLVLLKNDYSYRLRVKSNKKKLHINFKYPFIYNKNGLVTRREIKSEINGDLNTINLEDFIVCECLPNEHLKINLKHSCEFELQTLISTCRELFILSRYDKKHDIKLDFGVMCFDHSKILVDTTEIKILPQFEIEIWNDMLSPDIIERLHSISNTLQLNGFEIQDSSRYKQSQFYKNNSTNF